MSVVLSSGWAFTQNVPIKGRDEHIMEGSRLIGAVAHMARSPHDNCHEDGTGTSHYEHVESFAYIKRFLAVRDKRCKEKCKDVPMSVYARCSIKQ